MLPSFRHRWILRAAIACAVLAGSSTPASAGPDEEAAKALKEGKALLAKNKIAEACGEFAKSEGLAPKPETLLLLAQCVERKGQTATAFALYRNAAESARGASKKAIVEKAESAIAMLEPRLSTLSIDASKASPQTRVILLDGAVVDAAKQARIPLDPGNHYVNESAPGFKPWEGVIAIAPGPSTQTVAVPPLEEETPPPIAKVEDAEWVPGVGFVRSAPEKTAPAEPLGPPIRLPAFPREALVHVSFRAGVGVGYFKSSVQGVTGVSEDEFGPIIAVGGGVEIGRRHSLLAPWLNLGADFDARLGVAQFGGTARVGVDWHPNHWRFLGVGPFVGFWRTEFRAAPPSPGYPAPPYALADDYGPEFGLVHIHLRGFEPLGLPPFFEAEAALSERAGIEEAGTFLTARVSIGRRIRAIVFVDYKMFRQGNVDQAADAFGAYAVSFPERVKVGAAFGAEL